MQFDEAACHFHQRPFKPLLVRMVCGVEYRVHNPESIVSRRSIAFLLPTGVIEVVALEYVEAIRPLHRQANGAQRGKGKRRSA